VPAAGLRYAVRDLPVDAALVAPDLVPSQPQHFAGALRRDQDHSERAADDRAKRVNSREQRAQLVATQHALPRLLSEQVAPGDAERRVGVQLFAVHGILEHGADQLALPPHQEIRQAPTEVSHSAPQVVRHVKKVLSGAFEYGIAHVPGVTVNPWLGIKVTVPRGRRDRWLNDTEITAVLGALQKMANQKAADAYKLILCAAVKARRGVERSGRGHRDHRLADIRPHDFRRTARTHFPVLGVSEAVAEALLNYAKGEIEATYNLYTYWAERKQALALWHAKLASFTTRQTAAA
jgi:hypothetical protein